MQEFSSGLLPTWNIVFHGKPLLFFFSLCGDFCHIITAAEKKGNVWQLLCTFYLTTVCSAFRDGQCGLSWWSQFTNYVYVYKRDAESCHYWLSRFKIYHGIIIYYEYKFHLQSFLTQKFWQLSLHKFCDHVIGKCTRIPHIGAYCDKSISSLPLL